MLSETGLFCGTPNDIQNEATPFKPTYTLWSDGMYKTRWLRLPDDGVIDTSDPDHWSFPVGTRLWKQVADADGPLETRLMERWGNGDGDWNFATYVWSGDGRDADVTTDGMRNVRGTGYDVPSSGQCNACHNRLPERVLGFSAVQTKSDTLGELAQRFDQTPDFDPPLADADPADAAAVGLLHANCGNCHHAGPDAIPTTLALRLRIGQRTTRETDAFKTTVGVPTEFFEGRTTRIVPGAPDESALFVRLASRGDAAQMPPLGTNVIDHNGAITVGTWISHLAE